MYCNTYPVVLGVEYFSTFNETLEYFNDIWIIFIYYMYIMIIIEKKKIEKGVGGVATPQTFYNKSKIYKIWGVAYTAYTFLYL